MEIDYANLLRQMETLSRYPSQDAGETLGAEAARELRRNTGKLSVALEHPGDIFDRILYSVSSTSY